MRKEDVLIYQPLVIHKSLPNNRNVPQPGLSFTCQIQLQKIKIPMSDVTFATSIFYTAYGFKPLLPKHQLGVALEALF